MKRDLLVMGALGLGYLGMQRALTRRPVFTGTVSQHTDLIAWNVNLMECVEQIAAIASEEELERILRQFELIRTTSLRVHDRTSVDTLQRLISSTRTELVRLANPTSSNVEHLRMQTSIVQDTIPVVETILESIQHNHMLDTLV